MSLFHRKKLWGLYFLIFGHPSLKNSRPEKKKKQQAKAAVKVHIKEARSSKFKASLPTEPNEPRRK
jgi:hypothetical protein